MDKSHIGNIITQLVKTITSRSDIPIIRMFCLHNFIKTTQLDVINSSRICREFSFFYSLACRAIVGKVIGTDLVQIIIFNKTKQVCTAVLFVWYVAAEKGRTISFEQLVNKAHDLLVN